MSRNERQQRWRSKKANGGMVRLDTWAPTDRIDGLRAIIADMIEYPNMRVVGFKNEDGSAMENGCSVAYCNNHLPRSEARQALVAALDGLTDREIEAVASFCVSLVTVA